MEPPADDKMPPQTNRPPRPRAVDETRASIEFQLTVMRDLLRVLEDGIYEVGMKERDEHIPTGSLNLCTMDGVKKWGKYMHFQQMYGFELPLRIRYTFLLQLYTVFEAGAIILCDEICKRKSLTLSLDDVTGERTYKGIKTYLTKVFPVDGIPWGDLERMKDIRNCLIHCGGVIGSANQGERLKKFAKRWPRKLKILRSGYLFLHRDYCEELLRTTAKFFGCIFTGGGFGPKMVQYRFGHAQELIEVSRQERNRLSQSSAKT